MCFIKNSCSDEKRVLRSTIRKIPEITSEGNHYLFLKRTSLKKQLIIVIIIIIIIIIIINDTANNFFKHHHFIFLKSNFITNPLRASLT